jgi:hypothetical protein
MKQIQSSPQFKKQTAPSLTERAGGESVQNNQECFVQLWLRLERTRRLFGAQHKRFCIRNVLKSWFGLRATDDFIWEVCHRALVDDQPQEGWNELPPPMLYPRRHREFLRAIVAVKCGISFYKVKLKALDSAYSIAFPGSTPINVNKKAPSTSPFGGVIKEGKLEENS